MSRNSCRQACAPRFWKNSAEGVLSYQHGYHAGNAADVHKHALLAVMLDRMAAKPKPLWYAETHAGRGLYALDSAEARKTGEAAGGILRAEAEGWFAADHPYARALAAVRAGHGAAAYPGSPLIAASLLRPADRIELAELHPQEFAALESLMRPHGARCHRQDGPGFALSRCPPDPRRGLLLIDPSYEIRQDYALMPTLLARLHRKWNVGVIALWYPVLSDSAAPHAAMLAALEAAGYPGTLRSEVRFAPARPGHRMTGSGLFVINTPHTTDEEARRLARLFEHRL